VSVTAWAGPWPVDERWWDRSVTAAGQFQVVTDDGSAYLAVEGGWWREATYE
jgi:protein ImuB